MLLVSGLVQFRTTSSFPVPVDTVHHQMLRFSRVSRVITVMLKDADNANHGHYATAGWPSRACCMRQSINQSIIF